MALKETFKKIKTKIRETIVKVLQLSQSENVDNAEVKLIKTALTSGLLVKGIIISDSVSTTIAEEIVRGLNQLNEITQGKLEG